MVNLTRPDDPTRQRVCYASGHTLVVYDHETQTQTHLQGHRNPISCVVATEDRALVATADTGADAMIVLWDVDTGEPVRTLPSPHINGVAAMDITPGGDFCVTVGAVSGSHETSNEEQQEVHVWDLGDEDASSPVLSGLVPAGDVQTCVRFHPNAPTEFVTNGPSRVFFWSSESEDSDTLRYYSPPVSQKDFKQPIGCFTVSCFLVSSHLDVAGQGRCVTGTADGDLVVFDGGGIPPGGSERLEKRGMRAGDRRAVKIIRVHHAAVTHLSTTGGARYGTGARPQLVSGGGEGNVRFFDQKLRLVAWFDGLEQGGVTSVAFVAQAGLHEKYQGRSLQVDEEDEVEIPGQTLLMGAFDAPDFVVGTDHSAIYAFSSETFETHGSAEAVRDAHELVRGTFDAVVDMASHPSEPFLCCLGGGGIAWTWDYEGRFVVTKADLSDRGAGPKPTAVCYRHDGRGILVGTSNGSLKALDPGSLVDVQTMRFGKDAVTALACADDDECSYAAAADAGGCVAIFKLHGPIAAPASEEEEPERAFDFIGKYKAHSARSPVRGLAFKSNRDDGSLELVSVGAEGRVVRYDVFNSTEEGGVKVIDVRDDAVGGPAAGGVAAPTALAFAPDPRRPDTLSVLVADDGYMIRTVDVDTLTTTRTVLGPTFGGPVTRIVPFNAGDFAHAAYATATKVCGVAKLPLTGDPGRAMGVVAHPGDVGAICVAHDDSAVFSVGSHLSAGESSAGRVVNVWNVSKAAVDENDFGEAAAAARTADQLLEGGIGGAFYGEVKDYFLYSQLRAQGEDCTAARFAGIDKPVPTSEIPRMLRALGHYPSDRELGDIFRELAVEASGADGDLGTDPPATIGFDRFVSLYVNHRPMFGVDAADIESAFAQLGAGDGECVERDSLLEALEFGGEAMSREELVAAAVKLVGPGATLADLVPETVSAREFAEDVLGFVGVGAEEGIHA